MEKPGERKLYQIGYYSQTTGKIEIERVEVDAVVIMKKCMFLRAARQPGCVQ